VARIPGATVRTGAAGQIDVSAPFEAHEAANMGVEAPDDRPSVPVGGQEQGPPSPAHGAAGGVDVVFTSVAPDLFTPTSTTTGMTEHHPAFGC
jgi:hypothetical protein